MIAHILKDRGHKFYEFACLIGLFYLTRDMNNSCIGFLSKYENLLTRPHIKQQPLFTVQG